MTTNNTTTTNKLQFTTYTSEKTGKTCPVVYGFTGKEDERLGYICNMEPTPKAKKGKKAEKKVHGYAYSVYSCLPINGGDRVPCAIWGADPRWHEVAKFAAEVINDLDALTQEQYDKLGAMAAAVYNARKEESKAEKEEPKKAEEPKVRVSPKSEKSEKKESQKAKPTPKKDKTDGEVAASGVKVKKDVKNPTKTVLFTHEEVSEITRNALDILGKTLGWSEKECKALSELADAVVNNAARAKAGVA